MSLEDIEIAKKIWETKKIKENKVIVDKNGEKYEIRVVLIDKNNDGLWKFAIEWRRIDKKPQWIDEWSYFKILEIGPNSYIVSESNIYDDCSMPYKNDLEKYLSEADKKQLEKLLEDKKELEEMFDTVWREITAIS